MLYLLIHGQSSDRTMLLLPAKCVLIPTILDPTLCHETQSKTEEVRELTIQPGIYRIALG